MAYLRLFVGLLVLNALGLAAQAQYEDGVHPELNSQVEVLGVAKAENGWTGSTDSRVLDGGWTGALRSFPLAVEKLEFRLLFAPTGKRPDWWGQTDVGERSFGGITQASVENPALQVAINDKDFVALPIQHAEVRGPKWDEGLGLYTATVFVAPKVQNNKLWPKKYRHLRFSGQLPDLFSKPEDPIGLPLDIDFFVQKSGKAEKWVAQMRNRGGQYFLKSIRIDKINPQILPPSDQRQAHYQYESVTTLVGVWPTDIFNFYIDRPPVLNADGKRSDYSNYAVTNANEPDHIVYQPQPNMPFFVTRHVAIGPEPLADKENSALFFRSHLGWDKSPSVFYPFKRDGKMLLGDLPPSQWKFEVPPSQ